MHRIQIMQTFLLKNGATTLQHSQPFIPTISCKYSGFILRRFRLSRHHRANETSFHPLDHRNFPNFCLHLHMLFARQPLKFYQQLYDIKLDHECFGNGDVPFVGIVEYVKNNRYDHFLVDELGSFSNHHRSSSFQPFR